MILSDFILLAKEAVRIPASDNTNAVKAITTCDVSPVCGELISF